MRPFNQQDFLNIMQNTIPYGYQLNPSPVPLPYQYPINDWNSSCNENGKYKTTIDSAKQNEALDIKNNQNKLKDQKKKKEMEKPEKEDDETPMIFVHKIEHEHEKLYSKVSNILIIIYMAF